MFIRENIAFHINGIVGYRNMEQEQQNIDNFIPNEEYLQILLTMGINRDLAVEALHFTGNSTLNAALAFIFDKQTIPVTEGIENHAKRSEVDEPDSEEDQEYLKMVFIVNMDLRMGMGKVAAQVGHATLGLYRKLMLDEKYKELLDKWDYVGEKKIVVKAKDGLELVTLENKAKELDIPSYLVHDAGHTQIPAGSITVLGVFGSDEKVNPLTGHLKLL